MNAGNVLIGAVIAWGSAPLVKVLLKIFFILFCFVWISDCTYKMATGRTFLPLTESEKLENKKEFEARVEQLSREHKAALVVKMNAGDFEAQTELAIPLLYNDNPSDDQKAVRWLIESASKGYSEAQNHLGSFYMRTGNKAKARELWILAAQGQENRSYGTGSYKARWSLRRNFPADFDPKWKED